jgi:hypothetical protein
MAESLLVRKGGGGGAEVISFERTVIVADNETIKKGDLVNHIITSYSLGTRLETNDVNLESRSIFNKHLAKYDEQRVLMIGRKTSTANDAGRNMRISLIKRDKDNNLTHTVIYTDTGSFTDTTEKFDYSITYLGDDVFAISYTVNLGNPGGSLVRAFRFNPTTETITIGAAIEVPFFGTFLTTITATHKNGFVLAQPWQANTVAIRYYNVNTTTLAVTFGFFAERTASSFTAAGTKPIDIIFERFDDQLASFSQTPSTVAYSSSTGYAVFQQGTNLLGVVPFGVNYNRNLVVTQLSTAPIVTISESNLTSNTTQEIFKINQNRFMFPAKTGSSMRFIRYMDYQNLNGTEFGQGIIGSSKVLRLNQNQAIHLGFSTDTNLPFRYQIRGIGTFVDPSFSSQSSLAAEISSMQTLFDGINKQNDEFATIKFNDGTLLYVKNNEWSPTNSNYYLTFRLLTPTVKVFKPRPNDIDSNISVYGIALENKTSGQNIKVLAF